MQYHLSAARQISISIIIVSLFFSCKKKDDSTPAQSACFMVDATESTDSTHNFLFTNCTGPYSTYQWDFGDGHSSSDLNPSHRFNHLGAFTVKMTATNSSGVSDVNTRLITIGHNTLVKIIYTKLNSHVNFPKHVYLSYSTNYNLDNYVTSLSQLPLTVPLSDNVIYDNHSTLYYDFREDDLAGHTYSSGYFNVSDLSVTNGKIDEMFIYSGDTATFSLYFKIVPR